MDPESRRLAPPAEPPPEPATQDPITEVYKAIRAHELMLNEATSRFEHATATPLVLLNGGAAVAYLTLIGAISDPAKSKLPFTAGWAVTALLAWAVGLVAAQAAVTCGLISQRAYSQAVQDNRRKVEHQLLEGYTNLREFLVADVPTSEKRNSKREKGDRYKTRFDGARLGSAGLFLAGVALAALSIG